MGWIVDYSQTLECYKHVTETWIRDMLRKCKPVHCDENGTGFCYKWTSSNSFDLQKEINNNALMLKQCWEYFFLLTFALVTGWVP